MKRQALALLVVVLVFCLLSASHAAPAAKKDLVGFSVITLTDPFQKMLADGVAAKYRSDGVEVQIASCEMSPDKQVEQLENFAAMGCKHILCLSMNSSGLQSVVNRIRAKGVSILLIGASPPNYVVDGCVNVKNEDVGAQIAKMAIHWLDKKYAKAPKGSVKTALFTTTAIEDLKKRSDAMRNGIKADPRVKVVFEKENVMEIPEGNQGMQEAFAIDRDIKLVLAWNDALGIGINNVVMSEKGIKKDDFAIFTSAVSQAAVDLIGKSAEGGSVFRGTIKYGAEDVAGHVYSVSKKIYLKQVKAPYVVWDPILTINSTGYKVKW
jgi:ABC-type sugar transport system substrate-binding protein